MITFADETLVVGSSRLVRTAAGVSYRLSTSGLPPGSAAILWIVIFNEPDECTILGVCGLSEDAFVSRADDIETDVMRAAGSLVGGSGKATFAGRGAVGDQGSSLQEVFGLSRSGLLDARRAEIHLAVRTHGPVIRGLIRDMISTSNGGCVPVDPILGPLPNDPLIGPNACEDVHFAVHQP